MNQLRTAFVRFQKVLGKGLAVGVEKDVLKSDLAGYELDENYQIAEGPEKTSSVRCSGTLEGEDLLTSLILDPKSAKPLKITFPALPAGLLSVSRRLNVRQRIDSQVLGLAFARFPIDGISEEKSAFYSVREGYPDGYLNLDCLSKSQTWNPLFVKYRLYVVPSLKANEFGYLKIDVRCDRSRNIIVSVSRAQESEVPEILKTAKTLPR